MIALQDSNGVHHRLAWHDDGSGKPPVEFVVLGMDDKGYSIRYDWTATDSGWVAIAVHETVFQNNEPIAYLTTTYSGGGEGGPGDVQPMTLDLLASKLAGTLSPTATKALTPVSAKASSSGMQGQAACTSRSAIGLFEFISLGWSRTRTARQTSGGLGYPPSPPASYGDWNAFIDCLDALGRPLTDSFGRPIADSMERMLSESRHLQQLVAVQAVFSVWQLQSAIRDRGAMFKDWFLYQWDLNNCGPTVDWISCNVIGNKSGHPFVY